MKPIETYLNKDGWEAIAKTLSQEALLAYEEEYGEIEEKDKDLVQEVATLLALFSLYGVANTKTDKFSKEAVDIAINRIGIDYKGIDESVEGAVAIKQAQEAGLEADKIKELKKQNAKNKANIVFEGLALSIFHQTFKTLAEKQGKRYVGVITQNDERVRPTHRPNHKKYWEASTRQDFSLDFACRCYYYYGDEASMLDRGFTKYNM